MMVQQDFYHVNMTMLTGYKQWRPTILLKLVGHMDYRHISLNILNGDVINVIIISMWVVYIPQHNTV